MYTYVQIQHPPLAPLRAESQATAVLARRGRVPLKGYRGYRLEARGFSGRGACFGFRKQNENSQKEQQILETSHRFSLGDECTRTDGQVGILKGKGTWNRALKLELELSAMGC